METFFEKPEFSSFLRQCFCKTASHYDFKYQQILQISNITPKVWRIHITRLAHNSSILLFEEMRESQKIAYSSVSAVRLLRAPAGILPVK